MNPTWIVAGIALLTLASQVMGFIYLTKNHLDHIEKSLDGIAVLLHEHERRISTIEGVKAGVELERMKGNK